MSTEHEIEADISPELSLDPEIEAILDPVPTYEEYLDSAQDLLCGGGSYVVRYRRFPNPTLVRFAKAVVSEDSDLKSQVFELKVELGLEVTVNAHYDVMMHARMMRLTTPQVKKHSIINLRRGGVYPKKRYRSSYIGVRAFRYNFLCKSN